MKFESERLQFREIQWSDLPDFHKLHSFPEVDEFNTMGIPNSLEETKIVLTALINGQKENPRKTFVWSVLLRRTEEFIGEAGITCSLDKFKLGEIYYKLLPEFWNQGLGTEVAKTLITIGFQEFHLHKVEAGVATANKRSIHILEKCGMTREGLRRKILPIRGKWVDNYHYAILEDDPRDY